jgi:hypothetical protein
MHEVEQSYNLQLVQRTIRLVLAAAVYLSSFQMNPLHEQLADDKCEIVEQHNIGVQSALQKPLFPCDRAIPSPCGKRNQQTTASRV